MKGTRTDQFGKALLLIALAGLLTGLAVYAAGRTEAADIVWFVGVVPVLAALVIEILRSLLRGEVGLDIVAALSMTAALAFGETLAAAVVALMYSGGTFLESFAEGRARREMQDLLSRGQNFSVERITMQDHRIAAEFTRYLLGAIFGAFNELHRQGRHTADELSGQT
jgi:cation transport ATPase